MVRFAGLFAPRYFRFSVSVSPAPAQAEIITEHRLQRFSFALLEVTNARRTNSVESGSNSFYVRVARQTDNASIFITASRIGS